MSLQLSSEGSPVPDRLAKKALEQYGDRQPEPYVSITIIRAVKMLRCDVYNL